MIAVIDVSEKQKESVYFFPKVQLKEGDGAGSLLRCLTELLEENDIAPSDLEGIAVVLGFGRFTSTRSAVILANSFAFAHKIPIASFTPQEILDESLVLARLKQNQSNYLLPDYYAPPNITQKK